MPVGEHHDGYKMYDSDLSQWTSVKQAPHCDFLGELRKECDKQGVTFATSSHRAEHFWFLNGGRTVGYDNEVLDEKYRDFYGPAHNIHKINNLHNLLKQEHGITPTKEWLEDWLVNSCELIDKYHPETLFFDWWVMNYAFRHYMKNSLPITTIGRWNGTKRSAYSISLTLLCIMSVFLIVKEVNLLQLHRISGKAKHLLPIIRGATVRQTNSKQQVKLQEHLLMLSVKTVTLF